MRRRVLAAVLGLAAAPLAVEAWVRLAEPDARTQIVRAGGGVEVLGQGQARYWRTEQGRVREDRDCAREDTVLVFGSSILYGSGVEDDEVWTQHLGLPGTCVHNFSGPGYSAGPKLARLAEEIQAAPRLVVWEVWANDANEFVWVGDRGYSLNPTLPLDAAGLPDAFGLPPWLNGALFRGSRTYELLTLTRIEPAAGRADWTGPLDQALSLTAAVGSELLLVLPPVLDRPFADSVAGSTDFGRAATAWAQDHGIRSVRLAELLVDQDHEAIRLDPCCHYNAAGHIALGRALRPHLAPLGPEPSDAR